MICSAATERVCKALSWGHLHLENIKIYKCLLVPGNIRAFYSLCSWVLASEGIEEPSIPSVGVETSAQRLPLATSSYGVKESITHIKPVLLRYPHYRSFSLVAVGD